MNIGAEHVLLVLDIDNTMLAMNHDLGSDQWFEWQKYLLDNEPRFERIWWPSRSTGCSRRRACSTTWADMHPPQPDLPAIIGRLQELGIATLVLTSRGPEFRASTERELNAMRLRFRSHGTAGARMCRAAAILPYDLDDLEADGLTEQDVVAFKLHEPRPVSYANGVFMTAGQPKGIDAADACSTYADARHQGGRLCRRQHPPRGVRVSRPLRAASIEITAFHYTREDTRVKRFQYGDKEDVDRRWQKARAAALEEVFRVSQSSTPSAAQACRCRAV